MTSIELALPKDIQKLIHEKRLKLTQCHSDAALLPTLDMVIGKLDRIPFSTGYRNLAELLCTDALQHQDAGISLKLLLLSAIEWFPLNYARFPLNCPDYTPLLFFKEFRRILNAIDDLDRVWSVADDVFCKDLALCCARIIPVSCQMICISGIARRFLLSGSISALFKKLYYFCFVHRGLQPTFEIHMHPENRQYFGSRGRDQCYKVVADLLRLNPDFKGLQGSSWFYDPLLKGISPRLAFLHDIPSRHGAQYFFICNEGADSGSFYRSSTRLALYKEGKYQPRTYLLSWPRDALLDYAKRIELDNDTLQTN